MVILPNYTLNIYVCTYRSVLFSTLARWASLKWVVVKAEVHNWSKCWEQITLSIWHWICINLPPPETLGTLWKWRAERTREPVDGKESCEWLTSGDDPAVAQVSSQQLWLSTHHQASQNFSMDEEGPQGAVCWWLAVLLCGCGCW